MTVTFTEAQMEQLESIRESIMTEAQSGKPSAGRLYELYQRFVIVLREAREPEEEPVEHES